MFLRAVAIADDGSQGGWRHCAWQPQEPARTKNDPRPLHMLLGAVAILDQPTKAGTIALATEGR
jgi:hypothetical protein